MNLPVNTFDEELVEFSKFAGFVDPDMIHLMPPTEIVTIVHTPNPTPEQIAVVDAWMDEREQLWERANNVIEELPEATPNNLPGWVGSDWALTLCSKWAAGLESAIEDGERWLENR